jgi:hypothetical protein
MSGASKAASICRCEHGQGQEAGGNPWVVAPAAPTPGLIWLTRMPLGLPPGFRLHPPRPHLPLQTVQRLGALALRLQPGDRHQPPFLG